LRLSVLSMRTFLKHVHHKVYLVAVFFCFIWWWPWLFYWKNNPQRYRSHLANARRAIAKWSSRFCGFRFKFKSIGAASFPSNAVYCANHSSNLDIAALILGIPHDFSFLGKAELIKNPVTRLFFKSIDIPVLRSSKISAYRAYQKSLHVLKGGNALVIFPEGGISEHYPPPLSPFKSGSFRLAIEQQVPIVPIVIQDAWLRLWDDGSTYGSSPGTIHVTILAPISTKDWTVTQSDQLSQIVFDQMNAAIKSFDGCNKSTKPTSNS
jgi:1-acyl-sn-glycerol-3-phosphate acyltransferase